MQWNRPENKLKSHEDSSAENVAMVKSDILFNASVLCIFVFRVRFEKMPEKTFYSHSSEKTDIV